MGYDLGVDLGGTAVAAAGYTDSRAEMVPLGDGSIDAPAVVYRDVDGTLLVGDSEVVAHDASWVRDVIARSATTGPIPLPVAYSAYCIACARQPIGETCLCWGSDGNIPWRQRLPGGARRPGIGAAPRAPRSALVTRRSPCERWWARPSRWCACWGTGKRWSTAGGRGTDEHNASR